MLDDPQARAAMLRAVAPPVDATRRWMVPLGIAASVLVIASVVFVLTARTTRQCRNSHTVAQPALQPEVRTDSRGQRRKLRLRRSRRCRGPGKRKPLFHWTKRRADEKKRALKDATAPMVAAAEAERPSAVAAPSMAVTGAATGAGAPAARAAAAVPAGKLQYTILKRDTDGRYKAVDSGSTFASTDSVKLNVETGESGFLEVTQKDPPRLLYGGPVEKQVPVVIPATGSLPLGSRNNLQIQFLQKSFAAGGQANAAGRQMKSLSKQKAAQEAVSDKPADQAAPQSQPVTIEVDLKVAPQSKQ